jgi:hypothetical protein
MVLQASAVKLAIDQRVIFRDLLESPDIWIGLPSRQCAAPLGREFQASAEWLLLAWSATLATQPQTNPRVHTGESPLNRGDHDVTMRESVMRTREDCATVNLIRSVDSVG